MKLTEEQEKQIRKLGPLHAWKSSLIMLKWLPLLFAANMLISLINFKVVNNQAFCFVGGFLNAYFIFGALFRDLKKERDRVKVEIEKIISQ